MPRWVLLSLVALSGWGVGNFLRKQATDFINPWTVVVFQTTTLMTLATVAVIVSGGPRLTTEAVALAVAGGTFQFMANISLAFSLARGPASVIVPFTSMYPVVTLVLSLLLLNESISLSQVFGLVLSAAALYMFSR